MSLLLTRASALAWAQPSGDELVDLRIDEGLIVDIAPSLSRRSGEAVWDLEGNRLAPGLHDHHLHLRALCALESSVIVGPPEVQTKEELAQRLSRASARLTEGQWVRGVAYHESVAGQLDCQVLDQLVPDHPARIQHATGALWILNTRALEALDVASDAPSGAERDAAGHLTGRFWREDEWLGSRLPKASHDFTSMSQLAASRGVTGFTDATPGARREELVGFGEAIQSKTLVQRLHVMAEPGIDAPASTLMTVGPVKVLLDDLTLPEFDELVARLRSCHEQGRPVAVHCVTRTQAVLAVAALEEVGVLEGDRIEHASILGLDSMAAIARLGIVVVANPCFVTTRGDRFLRDVPTHSQPDLYRIGSLLAAGITVAGGSDAPFGSPDPWVGVKAAVDRETLGGQVLGRGERLDPVDAVRLFTSRADDPRVQRRVAVGQPADLCVVEPETWGSGSSPGPDIKATFVAGRLVYTAP
jgi:predicted amidohydrolase YtcJ